FTAAALAVAGHPPQDPVKDPGQTAPKQNPSYFNPQMAVIGDFAAVVSDNSGERRHADFREIEIALASDVDPFLKVAGFFSVAKEDGETKFEAEEVFGTYSKFGKGIQAKFGKIAAAVGRVQRNHVDQLDYLNYPLPITDVLGDEGMRVGGASFSYLFPGDRFMEFTGEILDAGDDGPVFNGSDLSNPAYGAHFRT